MPLTEIAKARTCGQVRFSCIYQYPGDLNRILQMCGLKANSENLWQIDLSQSIATLTNWLHKDAAYKKEIMSHQLAKQLATSFLNEFADSESRLFTNGNWFDSGDDQSWEPFTDSVFDGGILIEGGTGNDSRHFCIWFEDED